jgi:two-component system, OmpR family, phosphate regulon sensor histidine kinase PhoR
MYPLIRAVSIILFASVLLAATLGVILYQQFGMNQSPHTVAAILVAVLFTLPVGAVYLRLFMKSRRVERVSEEARRLAQGEPDAAFQVRDQGAIGQLAAALDELKHTIAMQKDLRQRDTAVMTEILNGLGEGLLAINRDKRVLLANRRFAELSGVQPSLGRPFLEILRNSRLAAAFDRALDGEPFTTRSSVVVNGEERQLEIRIFPVATSSEIAAVALLIDVTRIERLERLRRDFLADFSHEVRTPLAGLQAAVETLESSELPDEQEMQLKRVISRQAKRLERLVGDVHELSEIESGSVVLQRKPSEIKQLLMELCEEFRNRKDGATPQLIVEGDASLNPVDPERIQQVFANLIDNALKHARGATEVHVEVSDTPDETIARVRDNGEGIGREELERIFHRFYRVDTSRSQDVLGTGLGLAIAKHLVALHGGSIAARSIVGQGTVFEVRLRKS